MDELGRSSSLVMAKPALTRSETKGEVTQDDPRSPDSIAEEDGPLDALAPLPVTQPPAVRELRGPESEELPTHSPVAVSPHAHPKYCPTSGLV
jgi:hypothetical protein